MARGTLLAAVIAFTTIRAGGEVIDGKMHHLRHGSEREWADFPEAAEGDRLVLKFDAKANPAEQALSIRHRDLRHIWRVLANGKEVARLPQVDDETVTLIPLPPRVLRDGANELRIECTQKSTEADDVMVGAFELVESPRAAVVTQASVAVKVVDAKTDAAVPCRLTVVDERGALVPLGTEAAPTLAIRPGVVYTVDGATTLRLAAGRYTVYAGRGFEWGVASAKVELKAGENPSIRLAIAREVDTPGYVASDTHVHTFEFSRHGDATLAERTVTLAGEGIELPIATDHNLPVDYEQAARATGARAFFTPITGNEVTTPKQGHFNVFPVDKARPLIDFRAPTWEKLFADVEANAPGAVVILNHARDVHGTFRPFDPKRHLSMTGEDLDGLTPRANAMEVINSGATTTDGGILLRDWMGCVNRGWRMTPIGSSDSHDVARFIVGQGRTYVRVNDADASKIDTAAAVEAFKAGKVLVSYGLLAEMTINGKFRSGDLATIDAGGEIKVEVKVSGPAWTRAERVELYANGVKVRETQVKGDAPAAAGLKAAITWTMAKPAHDVFYTAIAWGPGVTAPYWSAAKPYQRTSPNWTPYVLACTGAVYVDADGSGTFDPALAYATRIVDAAKDDFAGTVIALKGYDIAVAAQAAGVLRARGKLTTPERLRLDVRTAGTPANEGFTAYATQWRESQPTLAPFP
jgi:hypothetical protein